MSTVRPGRHLRRKHKHKYKKKDAPVGKAGDKHKHKNIKTLSSSMFMSMLCSVGHAI